MANTDAFNNEFLAAALKQTVKRKPELLSKVLVSDDIYDEGMSVVSDVSDGWELGGFDVEGTIIQPGNTVDGDGNSFTPKGGVKELTHIGHVEKAKIDILFKEADMERMLPRMVRQFGQAFIESLPFEELVLQMIFAKAQDEIYTDLAWKGVKTSGSNLNTAVANGFLKLVTDAIAETATTGEAALRKIASGQILTASAYTSSNTYAQFLAQDKLFAARLRAKPRVTYCSNTLADLYDDNFLDLFGMYPSANPALDTKKTTIHRTNNKIVSRVGMIGSDRVIMTPLDNLELAFLNGGDLSNVKIQAFNRDLKFMADFKIGFGINHYDQLIVNSRA